MAQWQRCVIKASDDQVSCDLDGRTLLLQVSSGTYFGLNPVGAQVWPVIQRGTTFAEIVSIILQNYEAEANEVEADVTKLLESLLSAGLIQISDARTS